MSMDLAKKLYAKMPEVFAKARKQFGRGLTLARRASRRSVLLLDLQRGAR